MKTNDIKSKLKPPSRPLHAFQPHKARDLPIEGGRLHAFKLLFLCSPGLIPADEAFVFAAILGVTLLGQLPGLRIND